MSLGKVVGDGLAILAAIIALLGLALTLIGMELRNWQWSNAMLLLAFVMSGVTILCIALSFQNPSRRYLICSSIVLVSVNLLLYAVFKRNPLEF